MTAVIVLLIMIACIAFQYLKGTLARAVVTIFTTIIGGIVAFSYFEMLAGLLITRSSSSSLSAVVTYAQPLAFILLFIVSFAVLQTLASYLTKKSVALAPLAEKIGRVICGAIMGLLLAGFLLTVLDMLPIYEGFPYRRFQKYNPDLDEPAKAAVNVDGLAAGIFSTVSSGSFSGERSFAVIHPAFIDEVFLNRLAADKSIALVTPSSVLQVPGKAAAWPAGENVKTADDTSVNPKSGHSLTVVRVGLKRNASPFSLSQLRLICNNKANEQTPLKGKAVNAWPIGYFTAENKIKLTELADKIDLSSKDFTGGVKYIDFAFYVPDTHVPVLVAFKQNNIAEVPKLVGPEEAPAVEPF